MKITFNTCHSHLTTKYSFPEPNISNAFVLSNDSDYIMNMHFARFTDSVSGFKNTLFIVIATKSGLGFSCNKELFENNKLTLTIDSEVCVFKYDLSKDNILTVDSNENIIRITLAASIIDEAGNWDIMSILKQMKEFCNPEMDKISLSIEFPIDGPNDELRKELN